MTLSASTLRDDVTKAILFFSRTELHESLPFIHRFPKNCCELVAAFLAAAFESKYKNSSVEVICARSMNNADMHFWLEVDGIVVDATAHQFDQYSEPIVCSGPSPLEAQFPDAERICPNQAFSQLDFLSLQAKQSILSALGEEINS